MNDLAQAIRTAVDAVWKDNFPTVARMQRQAHTLMILYGDSDEPAPADLREEGAPGVDFSECETLGDLARELAWVVGEVRAGLRDGLESWDVSRAWMQ